MVNNKRSFCLHKRLGQNHVYSYHCRVGRISTFPSKYYVVGGTKRVDLSCWNPNIYNFNHLKKQKSWSKCETYLFFSKKKSFLFTQLLKYKCKNKKNKRRKRKKEIKRQCSWSWGHFFGQTSYPIGLCEEYIHREFFPFFGKPIGNFIEQA